MIFRIPLDNICEKKIETLSSHYDGKIEYIDISSIDNAEKIIINTQIVDSNEAPSRAKQLVKKGDILVSTVRPNLNAVAVIEKESDYVLVASTGYCVLRCNSEFNNHYVFHFCQSPYFIEDMVRQATGASYPAVSNSIVKSSLMPSRSLEEQQHIAAVLDKVSDLIALRKQQLDKLDELVKARFVEMFNHGFPKVKAEEVCITIVDCPHATPKYTGNHLIYPAIRTSEIKNGQIVWSSMKYVDKNEYNARTKRLVPKAGDIVYAREGTYGDCVILPPDLNFCLGQRTMLFRPNTRVCTSEYLHHALRSDDVKRQADESNAGSTVPHVNVADAKAFTFLLPPIELQLIFSDFIQQVQATRLTIQQGLDKLETMKKTLMQQYFG